MSRAEPPPPANRTGPDLEDAYREFRHPIVVLSLTTLVAGFLDAFAFLRYGAFVGNQSSNVLFLGVGPAGAHPAWPSAAASLVAFIVGAGLTTRLRAVASRWSPVSRGLVAVVATVVLWGVLNVLFEYGRDSPQLRALLAAVGGFSMGALATLFVRTAGVATTITYQSGTAAKIGKRVVGWLFGPRADRSKARHATLLGLLTLASYAVGGGIGALAQQRPLWVPVWAALALLAVALLVRHRS
ncbi:YoaK family protein [Micromonospora sp. NPDC051196]|uniref:YoaK family protein n=1 Tax=Micromonospora sp. NPDC051196 TaxID=3155281 RepID=UPI00343F8C64